MFNSIKNFLTPNKTLFQHLAGDYKINVFTDLEPDDVFAINLLHNYNFMSGRKGKIDYIVGEGDAKIKGDRMIRYLHNMNQRFCVYNGFIGNISPYIGYDSDKKYEYDGFEFLPKNKFEEIVEKDKELIPPESYYSLSHSKYEDKDVCNYPFYNNFYVPKSIGKYIDNYEEINNETKLYIVLKPPRELMDLWKNGKIDNSKKNLVIYGSFNLRCMMKDYTKDEILDFLNSFNSCYLYETYHVTSNNSFYNYKIERMFPEDLKRTIYLWNKSIYDDCFESVKSKLPDWNGKDKIDIDKLDLDDKDKAYVNRNYKVIKSIDDQFMQIVNADCGLISSLLFDDMKKLPIKDVELSFNEFGYTQYTEKPGSSIKMFILDKNSDEEQKFRNDQFHIFYKYISDIKV